MNHRQIIDSCLVKVLANLPDERSRQVFGFAEFLSLKEEQAMWSRPSPQSPRCDAILRHYRLASRERQRPEFSRRTPVADAPGSPTVTLLN